MAAESVQGLNAKVSGQRFGGFLQIEPGRLALGYSNALEL